MDSDTKIGVVDRFILVTKDSLKQTIETPINKNFTENPDATYGQVDAAFRAVTELSKNNFYDVICVTNISVEEIMSNS